MNSTTAQRVCAIVIIGPVTGFIPRPYQEHAINGGDPRKGPGIMPCFARHKNVLAVLFTGGGKTEIFLSLVRRYLESPKTPPHKRAWQKAMSTRHKPDLSQKLRLAKSCTQP